MRTGKEPFEHGIYTMPSLNLSRKNPKDAMAAITKAHASMKNEFIITLGGDHAVTLGAVRSYEKPFSVLLLDAHADSRYSWNGSQLNHACVGRRIAADHTIGIIGVRSIDRDEHEALKDTPFIQAHEYKREAIIDMLTKLEDRIYVSIDVDVFDPSSIRNTGTPEPGGLSWEQVVEIISCVFSTRTVIGADIVEFAPQENYRAEAYTLAKLCYRMMALKA
jgi:agmatinase